MEEDASAARPRRTLAMRSTRAHSHTSTTALLPGMSTSSSSSISSVSPDPAGTPGSAPTHTPTGTPSLAYMRASVQLSQTSFVGPKDEASRADDADCRTKLAAFFSRATVLNALRRYGLITGYSLLALVLLVLLTYLSFFAAKMDDGTVPEFVGCRSWAFDDNCGLWGIDCRPFETEWRAFRCPTKCNLDGDSSLVVYGSGPYRADSRICRAAIHAGVIDSNGGCGYYRYSGSANSFASSSAHGVTTQEFLSWFPKTMEFKVGDSAHCHDLSWGILSVGVVALAGVALLPRTNPAALFYALVGWGFFYVRIVGQPPSVDYTDIVIRSFAEAMVLLAASHFVYHLAPIHTFSEWRHLSWRRRVVLWSLCYVLPFNTLLHMNYFGYLPWLNIDLGGYEDGDVRAGTYIALALGVLFALACAFVFLRQLWRLGVWKTYVLAYGTLVVYVVLSFALFSSTLFHLHHTMLGAALIPFTRFPTPFAAFAQSMALGAFIQGYTAWGWAAYLTTMPTYLVIDQPELPPAVHNVTVSAANISWEPLSDVDGYSLRLNKVEVYRGLATSTVVTSLQPNMTYFVTVAGVASWGTNGQVGPMSNFTTLVQ